MRTRNDLKPILDGTACGKLSRSDLELYVSKTIEGPVDFESHTALP